MRIKFIDGYENAKKFNVGDIFDIEYFTGEVSDTDLNDLYIQHDHPYIHVRKKNSGYMDIGWSLICQSVFLILDYDTNRVLFTSKNYSQEDRQSETCPFYKELEEAFKNGFKYDDGLYQAPDADEFEDI